MKKITKISPIKSILPCKKRVVAYARVSTDKEAQLESLHMQVSYYSKFIQSNPNWEYGGIYYDEGLTGTKGSRPQFQKMIEDCKNGKINLIITKAISRFARNTVDTLTVVRELKALGVEVHFEKENISTLSGDGELMLTVLSAFAQEESFNVSENIKWQVRKGFKEGKLINLRFMFGYDIAKHKIEINKTEAEIVKMIFNDFLNGTGSMLIAKKLNQMKVPTPLGGAWRGTGIMRLLRNEKYTGNALLQKKFVSDHLSKTVKRNTGQLPKYEVLDSHPAIISQELFDKVQTEIENRAKKCNVQNSNLTRYPFTSKIICGGCGKAFKRRTTHKGKPYEKIMWQCSTYLTHGKGICLAKQIPEEILLSLTSEITEVENIVRIEAIYPNILKYIFKDGKEQSILWQQDK